jgi:predicted permease
MDTLLQDLHFGLRMLAKKPGFTAIAVLTIALGIGANTAIFSVVNSVLLRPLPYRQPQQLVRLYTEIHSLNLKKFWFSTPELIDIQKEAKSWEAIGGWTTAGANIGTDGEPIRVNSSLVTGSLIETLGVQPAMGRNFTAEEDMSGGPLVAIISYGLWQRSFGGRDDIIGREILVNSRSRTVVGVMPKDYLFPVGENNQTEVWLPFQFGPTDYNRRGSHNLSVIGRLKSGVTIQQAQSEMTSLISAWKRENRAQHLLDPQEHPVSMIPLHEDVVGVARPAVLMLMGAVAFVLLIACVNVASLLLARAESRHREFAVRLSLGAGLGRMARQFLVEGFLIVSFGATLGTILAFGGLKLLLAAAPDIVPRTSEIGINLPVFLFTFGLCAAAVFVFALTPMAQLRQTNLATWLRGGGQKGTRGVSAQGVRKALVVTEIALSVVLVIGSGLMLRAFWKLQQVNLGFDPHNVLTFTISLPGVKYNGEDTLKFVTNLRDRLSRLPGVISASCADGLPPSLPVLSNAINVEGYQQPPGGSASNVDYWNSIGSDYFKTMGIRTTEGRVFEPADENQNAQMVVVINQSLARRFWKEGAVGKRLATTFNAPDWFTIVGVVEDTKNIGIDKPAGTELYFLNHQIGLYSTANFVVRTQGNPNLMASATRSAVHEMDPTLPVYGLQPMTERVSESMVRPRFLSILLGTFSVIALLLAAVGIYGVMSYSVAQRTQEIGIRMALGAQKRDVLRLVLGHGFILVAIGTLVGVFGALWLTQLMSTLLFEITPTDPLTYSGVIALLGIVALLASYLPARRAAKVDPMVALRYY